MDPVDQAVSRIIKEQQAIIGPIALEQAKKVSGLKVTSVDDVKVSGNKKEVLGNLVNQYSKLFGKASVAVCKGAMEPFMSKIPASDIPDILKN
jgi:hypothetical protein